MDGLPIVVPRSTDTTNVVGVSYLQKTRSPAAGWVDLRDPTVDSIGTISRLLTKR